MSWRGRVLERRGEAGFLRGIPTCYFSGPLLSGILRTTDPCGLYTNRPFPVSVSVKFFEGCTKITPSEPGRRPRKMYKTKGVLVVRGRSISGKGDSNNFLTKGFSG